MRFFPRLRQATNIQRSEWKASHFGLHWEKIDEDISFESSSCSRGFVIRVSK